MRITLTDAPKGCVATVRQIDETHANPKRVWSEMGAPEYPSLAEVERLRAASRMVPEPQPCEEVNGSVTLIIALPPHAVAAIRLDGAPGSVRGGSQT